MHHCSGFSTGLLQTGLLGDFCAQRMQSRSSFLHFSWNRIFLLTHVTIDSVYFNSLSLSRSFSTDFFMLENKIILEVRKVNVNSFCNKLVFSEIKVRHFKIQLVPASPGIGFYWETFVTIWLLGRGLTIVKLLSLESFLQAVKVEYSFQLGRHFPASAACCYFIVAGFITVKGVAFGLILKLKSSPILVHVTQNSEILILIFICRQFWCTSFSAA